MATLHVPVHTFALPFVCLHVFFCWCRAYPEIHGGSNDTMVSVGGNLTLECNLTEPVGEDYRVLWIKLNASRFSIGGCEMGGDPGNVCHKYSNFTHDSRIDLVQMERRYFQLLISNITISDAGTYEFWIENNDKPPSQNRLLGIQVSVILQTTETMLDYFPTTSLLTTKFSPKSSPLVHKSTPNRSSPTSQSSLKESTQSTKSSIQALPLTSSDLPATESDITETSKSNILPEKADSTKGN